MSKLRKLFGPQKILPYFHFVENGNCAKYLIQRIDISQRLPEHPLEMHHVALQVPCLFIIKQISLKLSMKHRGNRYYCPPLFFFSTVKMVGSRRYSWLVGWLFFSTANYRIQNLMRNNIQQFLSKHIAEAVKEHMSFKWALETVNGRQ